MGGEKRQDKGAQKTISQQGGVNGNFGFLETIDGLRAGKKPEGGS
jgi:hypothetical protein